MPGDDEQDLDAMSPDRLRALRDEVLSHIEEIGSRDAAVEPNGPEEIRELDALLQEIESRLARPEPSEA